MIEIREYVDRNGRSPYARWFDRLSAQAAARVAIAVTRMAQGNLSNVKGVGTGLFEFRIDFGPGYRVYFGKDGPIVIILLAGGQKKSRQGDIVAAQERWQDYKRRKRIEESK